MHIDSKPYLLVVEDDIDNLNLLYSFLTEKGYNVIKAQSGRAALEAIERHAIKLVILDVILPDIDGYRICRILKISPKTNRIPVIMISKLDNPSDVLKGIMVEADAYITKPINLEELAKKVREFLEEGEKQQYYFKTRFTISSTLKYMNEFMEMVKTILTNLKLSKDNVTLIELGIYEAVANAVEWGNRLNPDLKVEVLITVYNGILKVTVKDEGPGFNPYKHLRQLKNGIFKMQEIRNALGKRMGGLGIMMVQRIFDNVEFRGNTVTMEKDISKLQTN